MMADGRARVTLPIGDLTQRGESSSSAAAVPRHHVVDSRQDTAKLPTAAELFVPSLPGLPNLATHPTQPLNLYAGSLPSYPGEGKGGGDGETGKDAMIFFMMARARRSAGKQRVIFWFNGGPGCSSFDGSLMEVGPFRTVPASQTESGKVELKLVDGGWEEYATVIFIDQPPGTGFSFVPTKGYLHELDQGSQHLIQFMTNFYKVFPELVGVDTYLAGESFAGQYIPYFTDALLKTDRLPGFNLAGIAIGNGWIDPKNQYPGYVDFAYEKGLIKKGTPASDDIDHVLEECMKEIAKFPGTDNTPVNIGGACESVMSAVTQPFTQELNGKRMCMNVYDVRLMDDWPACGMNWPPDIPDVYDFLRRGDVINSLHAEDKGTAWVECDSRVSSELRLRSSPASVVHLPSILERGVKVMMFAGAEDLICNYKGIERMIENLEWAGETGFTNATKNEWYLNDTQVGEWTERGNLTYVKVFDSSHMVGFDVPHVSNDMITRFMDVDLSLVPGTLASASGKLGSIDKIALGLGTPASVGLPLLRGGKDNWDSWYNAGSAFFILFILLSIVGLYFYFKRRKAYGRRSRVGLGLPTVRDDAEERVPLGTERVEMDDIERAEQYEIDEDGRKRRRHGKGKGKERARDSDERDREGEEERRETVFALGDEDEDK